MTSDRPTTTARALDLDGAVVGYRETGDPRGRPVVFLHALASTAATWDAIAEGLATIGCRAIAFDLPGHGSSWRPGHYDFDLFRSTVVSALDRLALPRVDLIGHSLGGYIATLVAQSAPDRLRTLVLEDTPPPPRDAAAAPRHRMRHLAPILLAQLDGLRRTREFDHRSIRPLVAHLRQPDPEWWSRLGTLTMPTLVISGGPSSHIAPARLEQLTHTLPNAEMVTIPVGHRVHSHNPGEFATAVARLLESTRSEGE
ncbi:alpha/beta fold hydrolase [Nocardia transvalensis]|uniref:alpha/beta fold hydrolase n=1 Tax=Nocardia transvalensis TaxID=37333 RepID=UPI001895CD71|nr:alpha/beta fold hydrolase [Nocardia transvalensis]MBF6329590.1 alpha/beta fold hydrolase [Nocardia transvalensis]